MAELKKLIVLSQGQIFISKLKLVKHQAKRKYFMIAQNF